MKTTRRLIRLTRADIENGVGLDRYLCPIACALRRHGLSAPEVGETYVTVGPHLGGTLSERAKRFIQQFDDGRPVQPFSFYLALKRRDQ